MDQFDQLDVLARLDLIFENQSGSRRLIVVELGQPESCENGAWKCRVTLAGIDHRTRSTYGVDALQAICLTLRYIAFQLKELLINGGKLLHGDGDEFPLDAYFGAILRNRQSNTEPPHPNPLPACVHF